MRRLADRACTIRREPHMCGSRPCRMRHGPDKIDPATRSDVASNCTGEEANMAERNRRLVLAERPTGMVDERTVRVEEADAPEPGPGEALARVRYLSIDPTIRTWMDDAPGYLPPIAIDEVVRSGGIVEVVDSNSEKYKTGDLLFGFSGWQDYV